MAGSFKIFISYRRDDSDAKWTVRAIRRALNHEFGEGSVIRDVDDIPIGQNWWKYLEDRIKDCDLVIAAMGKQWLPLLLERIASPKDFVRKELELSESLGKPIIPLLIEKTQMPDASVLPDSLKFLPDIQAFELDERNFDDQVSRLIFQIRTHYGNRTIVSIATIPSGARVFDEKSGRDLGVTPIDGLELSRGEFSWSITKDGFDVARSQGSLTTTNVTPFVFSLIKSKAVVSILTEPQGATITDRRTGRELGVTPIVELKVEPGEFEWEFSMNGFETAMHSGVLQENTMTPFEVSLWPAKAVVSVVSVPPGLLVKDLNTNLDVGITPLSGLKLAPGEYEWEFSKVLFTSVRKVIMLTSGFNPPISVELERAMATVSITTEPAGADVTDIDSRQVIGRSPIIDLRVTPADHRWEISKEGYRSIVITEKATAGEHCTFHYRLDPAIESASRHRPFYNSLGMPFVPVQNTSNGSTVLFCVWETRVSDFAAFREDTKTTAIPPGFPQTADHPAVNVTWEEAVAFCEWLTQSEWGKRSLPPDWHYRLPMDHEWSCAIGIGEKEKAGYPPHRKHGEVGNVYGWGTEWPPPSGIVNSGHNKSGQGGSSLNFLQTSPVGSFPENPLGLFDLGGNVWEWCMDWFNEGRQSEGKVCRGGSWMNTDEFSFRASCRSKTPASLRAENRGFRVVIARGMKPANAEDRFGRVSEAKETVIPLKPAPKSPKKESVRISLRTRPDPGDLDLRVVPPPPGFSKAPKPPVNLPSDIRPIRPKDAH